MPYLFIDGPKEVDLICQTLQLGLQLNLIHVGLINILETKQMFDKMIYQITDIVFRREKKWQTWYDICNSKTRNDTDLLDENKVILTLCAPVDLVFIPKRTNI